MVITLVTIFVSWFGCYAMCRELAARGRISPDWRVSWLMACVWWGVWLTLVTEVSSARRALTAPTLLISLASFGLLLGTLALWAARARGAHPLGALTTGAAAPTGGLARGLWRSETRWWSLATGLLTVTLGGLALVFPTTNWDSMTYHLPRMVQWVQQHSVAHYLTVNSRQLEFGPWASFVATAAYVLPRHDRLVTMVQWFSMVTSLIAVAALAERLLPTPPEAGDATRAEAARAMRRRVGAVAALLTVTLPIGLTESITTQNDYVVTCWFVTTLWFAYALHAEPANLWYTLGLAGAVGLGVLTKSTMLFYAAPLMLLLPVAILLKLRSTWLRLRLLVILAGMVGALTLPHMYRNLAVYDSPLGSQPIRAVVSVSHHSLGGLASNVIRNLSLHTPTGVDALTNGANDLLAFVHRATGKDLNDPDTTFQFMPFTWSTSRFVAADSVASCPAHVLLILLAIPLLIVATGIRSAVTWYAVLVTGGFLLFCLMLRWQPWHARLHLALLVALMPVVAVALVRYLPRPVTACVGVLVSASAGYVIATNLSCPLYPENDWVRQPREQQYFLFSSGAYQPYVSATEDIIRSGCRRVGLKFGTNDLEYPIWMLLRERGYDGVVASVGAHGREAERIPSTMPWPCAIVTFVPSPELAAAKGLFTEVRHGPVIVYFSDSARQGLNLPPQTSLFELSPRPGV